MPRRRFMRPTIRGGTYRPLTRRLVSQRGALADAHVHHPPMYRTVTHAWSPPCVPLMRLSAHPPRRSFAQAVFLDLGVQEPPIDPELIGRLGSVAAGPVQRLLDQLPFEGRHPMLKGSITPVA